MHLHCRTESPQELEKGIEPRIRESIVLEREANQLHEEGRFLAAKLSRSKANTRRLMADSLQQRAVLLAQQPGKLQCMTHVLLTKAVLLAQRPIELHGAHTPPTRAAD